MIGGRVALTGSGLCPVVHYFELLSQQFGRVQSQAYRWRQRCRIECSGNGLGMLRLGSRDLLTASNKSFKLPGSHNKGSGIRT